MVSKFSNQPTLKQVTDKINAIVNDKQDKLVSGTNIKTINNENILGSGNISIGGGGSATDVKINGTSITSQGIANILTNSAYSSSNKLATMSDVPAPVAVKNVGELVQALLPLTDAGLHLLDGSLLQYGSYKDFIDYIADLYADTPSYSTPITLPYFTSNTENGITIADARNNTYILQNIFNGSKTYNSVGAFNTYWISIDYGISTLISSYSIQADNKDSVEYPTAWTLQASNDGNNWTTLDSQTGQSFTLGELKTYTVTTSDYYRQYKLVFSAGNSSGELQKVSFDVTKNEKPMFCSETDWQNSVSNYGVCGKFVYDSLNNTVRLPKISGKLEGISDGTTVGDLIHQYVKLPNITSSGITSGWLRTDGNESQFWTGSLGRSRSGVDDGQGTGKGSNVTLYLDASRSSNVYSGDGTNTKIHEQAIQCLVYIVIANTTKTAIQVDIDEIATDLNGKVDKADMQEVQCVVETYQNGTSWYRVWSDGWLEQGGSGISTDSMQVTLLRPYRSTDYVINAYKRGNDNDTGGYGDSHCEVNGNGIYTDGQSVNGFRLSTYNPSHIMWMTSGYGAL